MAISKVPDLLLEKLLCSCGRYLSSAPISVCQDGRSVCSKCTDLQAPQQGTITQNFAYETLAALFKFPCCYKSKGCSQFVEFNKAAEHEDECQYRIYDCPVNLLSSCDKKGPITELWEHYKQDHPGLFLQDPINTVDVTSNFEVHRLYKINDVVLLLQTKCSTDAGRLWFNAIYFGNTLNSSLINYNIKLSNMDDKKRVMELEQVKTCSINTVHMLPSQYVEVDISIAMGFLNHTKFQCQWVFSIPEELNDKMKHQQKLEVEEMFESNKEKLRCPFCRISMVPPIYRCDQNHITCIDCQGYENHCKRCFKNDVRFTIADDLEMISKSGKHLCKWINCNQEFSYDTIRVHEQACPHRVYKCPECSWCGFYDVFLSHLVSGGHNVSIHTIDPVVLNQRNYHGYIMVDREIFKYSVTTEGLFGALNMSFNVHVYFLGTPSYVNSWKYEVKDNFGKVYSCRGEQSCVNKIAVIEVLNHFNFNTISKSYVLCISKK